MLVVNILRSPKVLKERKRVLELVHKLSLEDVRAGKDFIWRYEEFKSVNFFVMIFSFWRPIKSFYKDMDCINKDITKSEGEIHGTL
jgi:hypothetical protein